MNTLDYRKSRILKISQEWNLDKINPLITAYKIPIDDFKNLKFSIKLFISKALHFDYSDDDQIFLENLKKNRTNRKNITPNGAVVPKKEYSLVYNLFLKSWADLIRNMVKSKPSSLTKFRITPNVRIKFGLELDDNVDRALNTSHPHSDAWLEGPFGLNCHIPVMGDTYRNYLMFYELTDEKLFNDDFLKLSESYTDMQWVEKYYEINKKFIPQPGFLYLSDYALLHKTFRAENCSDRVSIDSTVFYGNHDVSDSRTPEYIDGIPEFGCNLICKCNKSEEDKFDERKVFSHYAVKNLEYIKI